MLSHCPKGTAPSEMDEEVQVADADEVERYVSTLLKLPPDNSHVPDPEFLAAEQ